MPVDLDRLASIGYKEKILRTGSLLFRIYFRSGEYPGAWNRFRTWGPHPECRFDHHAGPEPHEQDRAVLYAAETPNTALVEVFDSARAIHRTRDEPALVQFALAADLRLIDFTDSWIHRAGGKPTELLSGNREGCREWARAVWSAYEDVQGIYYRSVLNPGAINVALFERARGAMPGHFIADVPLTDPGIRSILDVTAYDFDLELL